MCLISVEKLWKVHMTSTVDDHARASVQAEGAPGYTGMPAGRWLDVGGIRTWYTDIGVGTPILLVHGGHAGSPYSSGAGSWSPIFASRDQSKRILAVDRIGQGFTDNPIPIDSYTLQVSADHLIAFLDKLDIGPVHLVGHSRGGYVATRAALERQDLIRSLTLVNSSTLAPGVGTNEVAMGRIPQKLSRESIKWMYNQYHFDPASTTDDQITACWNASTSEKYRALLAEFASKTLLASQVMPQLAHDKRETLGWLREGRLQRPVHIIWGRNDLTARPERGIELFSILREHERRTTFSLVEKSGHFPFVEHPEWFNRIMFGFVDEVENALY
jgi:pimeloyl-ACP methyl ester carboxylesterase